MNQYLRVLMVCIVYSFSIYGQESRRFDAYNPDVKYLEHLVKARVDEVRAQYQCDPLVNDSILYVASVHHAQYMQKKRRLSHEELDSANTRTPQDRAEFFGAVNYAVGENVLYVPSNTTIKNKKGKKFETYTYGGLADAMVDSWVNSPGHFKNIITPDYQITGLSVSVDAKNGRVYACQKFAKVHFTFEFEENQEMFSYSNYKPVPVATSFEGISNTLIEYTYDFGLKHDDEQVCAPCLEQKFKRPYLSLELKGNYYVLRVENSDFVENLMDRRTDGFAVELVSYDDYVCGNPAYYTKPSRRNGQLKLNGRILEPLYRNDLQKGFKKRKKRPGVKFVSYILKADSVNFFRRFGRYKRDRYSSKYFEIKLAKVPKDLQGVWVQHNLVYIQEKQICDIDYFTSYCGELTEEYDSTIFIPFPAEGHYDLMPELKKLQFTVPFEQGKSRFTNEDITPFIESLQRLDYRIDSLQIDAYASVEGDSVINKRLQQQRAESIVEVLQEFKSGSFPVRIQTFTDWDDFFAKVKKSPRFSYLASKSKSEIKDELKKIGTDALEPLLSKQRRGEITLWCTIDNSDKNLAYLIKKEYQTLLTYFRTTEDLNIDRGLAQLEELYTWTHRLVVEGRISPSFLAAITMPKKYQINHTLTQKYLMYGYEFEEEFQANKQWNDDLEFNESFILKDCSRHRSPYFVYRMARVYAEDILNSQRGGQSQVEGVFSLLSTLGVSYRSDSVLRENVQRLNANMNMFLLNRVFVNNEMEKSNDAFKSIVQLYSHYTRTGRASAEKLIQLGKMAVHYNKMPEAADMIMPHAKEDSIKAYLMGLFWRHPSNDVFGDDYYAELISLSKTMDETLWCNMFFTECGVPFQSLDNEELRIVFCEKCQELNAPLNELKTQLETTQ